jgi:hypothetical protein
MSDLNFNLIPSEIKCFIPGKETFNDISLVLLSVGVKVPPGSMTPTIILLSLVTWIPWGNKDDDTEKNGFISPTKVQGHYLSLVWMVNNNILINMTVTNTDCLLYHTESQQIITKT